MSKRPDSVPARENASLITGQVQSLTPLDQLDAAVCEIRVHDSRGLASLPDFAARRVGETIRVYGPSEAFRTLKEDEDVEMTVSFFGDEKGGEFVLTDDAIRRT